MGMKHSPADIEEMIKTLDMEDELKQEFNKFVADKLGSSNRPKFKPSLTGLRDRAKIRNNFLRTRFQNPNNAAEDSRSSSSTSARRRNHWWVAAVPPWSVPGGAK